MMEEKGFKLMKALQKVAGDELAKVEMIERIRKILMDFLRGYPAWRYYGIIEFYFKGELGKKIIQILKEHEVIDVEEEKGVTYYWLKPRGIEIAISLSNKRDSKRVLSFAEETSKFNRRIIFLTTGLFIIGIVQLILIYKQNPIF
jgi:hypothetical protein